MKKLIRTLFFSFGLAVAGVGAAQASPAAPVADTDYKVVKNAPPLEIAPGKIEVTEFFWYGCPHCKEFDPHLEKWVAKQRPDVVFKRVPVAFRQDFVPHSKLYHALDALGLANKLTPVIFNEIHEKKDYLLTPETQAAFLATQGVDKQKFLAAYNSFSTQSELQRDAQKLKDYNIDGVPTLIVQGKYETSPSLTGGLDDTLKVLDYLVAQVRAKKL